jgi:ligand-binding sensor domain-containing protein
MKIFKCIVLILFSNILLNDLLFAVETHWENFNKGDEYKCIVETTESIWIGSRAGLIERNKQNARIQLHTRASDGLPSNYIVSLASDKDEVVWIGTFGGGLIRFNGVINEVFNTQNSKLPGDWVRSTDIDNQGSLWICTDSGLAIFNYTQKTWTLMTPENGFPAKSVYCSKIDASGTVWISGNDGLLRYKDSMWKIYNSYDPNFFWYTCDGGIHADKNDQIWIGTAPGLLKYNKMLDTFELVNIPDGQGNNMLTYITSIYEDQEANIWVTSLYAGLAKFDGQEWTLNTSANYKDIKGLWSFHIDMNNNKWAVGESNMYIMTDGETFNLIQIPNFVLNSNKIRDIFVDQSGKTWMLTLAYGINTYFNNTWESYTFENARLPSNWSRCICEDKIGGVWIGTNDLTEAHDGGGLVHVEKNNQITFIKENDISSNHINAIACDSKNQIWVCTRNGISVYNASNHEKLTTITNVKADLRGICITSSGDVYVFDIFTNIYHYQDDKWIWFKGANNSNSGEDLGILLGLSVDSNDNLYALYEFGLWKHANSKWTKINQLNDIAPPDLLWGFNNLYIDKNDVLWITSNHYGVIRNAGNDWQLINLQNSKITSNNINKVFVDKDNNEWYATNYDGVAVKYANNTDVDDSVLLPNFKLYPNPASEYIVINLVKFPTLSKSLPSGINIYNTFGECVSNLTTVISKGEVVRINISDLPVGIYFVKFGNYSEKFVVVR